MATPRSIDRLTPGGRIGPYLLLAPLGSGGSGRVWAVARMGQLGFSKRMVLKVMREDKLGSERARQRFEREARLGARLRHPNLRAVHDLGSYEGRPFMSLSWVDTSLDELLEHAPLRRLEPIAVCWLGIQICSALAAAHGHVNHRGEATTIVHGDVSPGNILLTQSGHVLVADLAASDEGGSPPRDGPRTPGRFFGSVGYASPEALRGEGLDPRADLFSLGCVLYEALCGSPAFEGDDERWIVCQVLEHDAVDLRQRAPEVPVALADVVRRAMQRAVEERFADAAAMGSALRACVPGLPSFALEERTAAIIASVLGERISEREQRMRQVFQRFSLTQLERTDTLPIGRVQQQTEGSDTLTISSAPGLERSAGADRARPRAAALGLLALAVVLAVTASRLRWTESVAARGAGIEASVAAALTRGPLVVEASPRTLADRLPADAAAAHQEAAAPQKGRAQTVPPPAAKARASASLPPAATPPAALRRRQRSLAPPPPPEAVPARDGPAQPFVWRLPKNPYAKPAAPPGKGSLATPEH